jgi:hypothetical protein
MPEVFASGRFDGIGGLTAVAHATQGDNTIAATAITGAMDQPGWHVGQELWLTIRPAISQIMRRTADTIWDHAVLWAAAAWGWIAAAVGWVGVECHDLWQAAYQKAITIIQWFIDHL